MLYNKLQIGPCEGIFIRGPPPREKFLSWLSQLKMYVDMHKISVEVFVVGTYVETPSNSSDVDVILTHPKYKDSDHKYKLQIRDLLIYGTQLGLSMNMFIDMDFYIPFNENGDFWYSSRDFQKTGNIIQSRILSIRDKFIVDDIEDETQDCYKYSTCTKIDQNLFEILTDNPDDKHIQRIKNGILYEDPKLLFKTTEIYEF